MLFAACEWISVFMPLFCWSVTLWLRVRLQQMNKIVSWRLTYTYILRHWYWRIFTTYLVVPWLYHGYVMCKVQSRCGQGMSLVSWVKYDVSWSIFFRRRITTNQKDCLRISLITVSMWRIMFSSTVLVVSVKWCLLDSLNLLCVTYFFVSLWSCDTTFLQKEMQA